MIVPIFEKRAPGRLPQLGRGGGRGRRAARRLPQDAHPRRSRSTTRSTTSRRARSISTANPRRRPAFASSTRKFGRIGVLICWDQWYPEAARITALMGAQVLFYPTAIGWHPKEKGGMGCRAGRRVAHDRSGATRSPTASMSPPRIGWGIEPEPGTDGIEFFGHSFVCDPFGQMIAEAGTDPAVLSSSATPSCSSTRAATGLSCATAASTRTGPILNRWHGTRP